jgi:ABC-type glutathione transport system ATPase component
MTNVAPLLEVENLSVQFVRKRNWLGRPRSVVNAIEDVSLNVAPGECLGIVGESGSGKSTLAAAIAGLIAPRSGTMRFRGGALRAGRRPLADARRIQIVFQDPGGSLDPHMRIWQSVSEGLLIHREADRATRRRRAAELLETVGLDGTYLDRHPHALSGGQRQRVAIARALSLNPELILLDEPTSALDMTVQAQVLNLLLDVQAKFGVAFVLITHDMSVANFLCHRIAVMRNGRIVEQGSANQIMSAPQTDYARNLVAATPRVDADSKLSVEIGEPA